ncbi:hypothetical protein ACBZ90_17035 [Vibrio alginolyticus]
MSASSEFILAPRLDERKMKEESKKMEVQLRRASKQAADDFEFWFGKGFEKGAEKGSQKVKSKLGKLQGFMILTGPILPVKRLQRRLVWQRILPLKLFKVQRNTPK